MLKEVLRHFRDTHCFDKYKEKVAEFNANAIGLFILFGLIVSAVSIVLELTVLRTNDYWFTFGFAVYFLISFIAYRKNIEEYRGYSTLLLYLVQLPVVILTIIMGTIINPDVVSFTFMVALISLPIFILDKPARVLSYIVLITLAFVIMDIRHKTGVLLLHDLMHTALTFLVSIGTTTFVLDNRILNVEKSEMFQTDSEHDPLTGIYNRRGGEDKIKECIANGIPGTFILLDIDDFKHVNDTYGHTKGDEILSLVSMTLANSFRSSDVVMRMGGDEFVVFAPGLVNYFFIDGKLKQINAKMREITCVSGRDNITVSMGAVINDGKYPDYDTLFNEADSLLYETKLHGKNGFRLQDRPYEEIKTRPAKHDAKKIRAERDAASEAEESKYKS